MFNFNGVSAPLILNGEVVKVSNISRKILFSGVCLGTLQTKSIVVIFRQSGRISPTIRPDSWIPEKQAGQPDNRIRAGYRCDPNSDSFFPAEQEYQSHPITSSFPEILCQKSKNYHKYRYISITITLCFMKFFKKIQAHKVDRTVEFDIR